MINETTAWTVHLDSFEGPLDLLLHLIKEMKIDIFDIPMVEITDQYFHYLRTMQELRLDIAGDYLVMAATLLEVKSRMLLPKKDVEIEEEFYEEGEDPREELVNQLLEHKRIQEAAKLLKEMEQDRGAFFTKLPTDLESFRQSIPLTPGEVEVEDLLVAIQKMYRRLKNKKVLHARLDQEEVSVERTMAHILQRFRNLDKRKGTQIPFSDFFEIPSKTQIVNTFLAMLELVKQRQIRFTQMEAYGEILLEQLPGDE